MMQEAYCLEDRIREELANGDGLDVPDAKLYRVDLHVTATAYIRADSPREAREIADRLKDHALEVEDTGNSDVEISGRRFNDPALPDVSLSPSMTVHGLEDDAEPEEVD